MFTVGDIQIEPGNRNMFLDSYFRADRAVQNQPLPGRLAPSGSRRSTDSAATETAEPGAALRTD